MSAIDRAETRRTQRRALIIAAAEAERRNTGLAGITLETRSRSHDREVS